MDTQLKTSAVNPKFFFSDDFLMQVRFEEDDLVEGWIVHYPIGLNLAENFRGISFAENGSIKFSFFVEWIDPNLSGRVLTAYAGEFSESGSTDGRLALEWLQISENPCSLAAPTYKGIDVLHGLSDKDPISQARRLTFLKVFEKPPERP